MSWRDLGPSSFIAQKTALEISDQVPSTLMVNHNSMVKVDKTDYEGIAIIVTTCSMFALWSVVSVAVPVLGVVS